MLDPILIASVPHRNLTAFRDLSGTIESMHRAIAQAAFGLTGTAYRILPLGDGRGDASWLQALQAQHEAAAQALSLTPPADLSSYDLREADQWASFTWVLSQDLIRLRDAAGVT